MTAHKIYKSIYKKHTQYTIQKEITDSEYSSCSVKKKSLCPQNVAIGSYSSATPEHKFWMEYFDNILPYSWVHIVDTTACDIKKSFIFDKLIKIVGYLHFLICV